MSKMGQIAYAEMIDRSYHIEDMRNQSCGIGFRDRLEAANIVEIRAGRDDSEFEGCIICDIDGNERIFKWIWGFATFVRQSSKHGMVITNARHIGDPESINGMRFRYIVGTLRDDEMERARPFLKHKQWGECTPLKQ